MIGILGLFTLMLWCSYVTSVKEMKNSKELEFDIKTGVTALIPAARNRITVFAQLPLETYCTITECKTITCNLISSSDSGQVASTFLTAVFKAQCPTKTIVSNLIFVESNFPDNQLSELWLTSTIQIESIKFENCELNEIKKNAFSSSIFKSTKSFSIISTKIAILNKYVFEELSNLHNLVIQNNLLVEVEYNLLNNAAETLETIELDKSIENIQVLYNITRGKQLLNVQLLSLQGNNIPNLSNDVLQAFPNIISLYMDSSKIKNIHQNTFESCQQLKQIFFNNNELTTLSEGIFDSLLHYSPQFKVAMTGNPWNCECDLKWIQNMLFKHPKIMIKTPYCKNPKKNANKSFLTAEYCGYQLLTTLETSTTFQSTTELPISYSTQSSITILCQNSPALLRTLRRKLFSISDYEFPSKQSGLFLQQLKNGSINVNLSEINSGAGILWFSTRDNDVKEVNCLRNIKGSIILNNLQEDSLYTICLLEKLNLKVSPFNCMAFKTLPAKNARIWLSNGDKTLVLSIYTVIAFLFCLLGGGSCFYIIKKNPTLLKGSKRVILVKRGQVNTLVLPKGINNDFFEKEREKKEEKLDDLKIFQVDYLTPIKKRNCLSNIYESIDNKMSKNLGTYSRESIGENIPPPLPPHPFHGIVPSVSLLMDSEHKITGGPNEIQDDTEIYSCIQPK